MTSSYKTNSPEGIAREAAAAKLFAAHLRSKHNHLTDDQIVELLKTEQGTAARDILLKELGQRLAAEITAKEEAREARRAKHAAALEAAKRAKRRKDYHRKGRETFKRIVAELGTTFEVTSDGYVEVAPWEGYPLGFTTLHYDWTESHERFECALGDPTALDENGYYTG